MADSAAPEYYNLEFGNPYNEETHMKGEARPQAKQV
jgi:hypothetical protein